VFRAYRELWIALLAIAAITALYLLAYSQASTMPAASSLVGHGIGILGFVLMLMTETLYSIRKRLTDARWGSTAAWLKFHMVTGLVGPYMVFLHTSIRLHGLAGLAMLLTVVVVVSGLVGRYVYTAMPRVLESAEANRPDARQRQERLVAQRGALATWHTIHVPLTWALFAVAFVHIVAALYYATLPR